MLEGFYRKPRENGPIFCPCCNRLCLKDQSIRYDTKYVDRSAEAQAKRKNKDSEAEKSLELEIKTGKKKKPQSKSNNTNQSITISTSLSGTGLSGARPFRAVISFANAAQDVQSQLQKKQERQDECARLEWKN